MTSIFTYLTFSGNCREAMLFYQKCLGGKLTFQTMGKTCALEMPRKMKDVIMHASLVSDTFVLMGSDLVGERGLKPGNSISMVLNCGSGKQLKTCYKKLSAGGEQTCLPEINDEGALFGNLVDRYGNSWILRYRAGT